MIYRTQLFNPADMDNVKKVQAGYKVQPLSAFLGKPAPPAAPAIDWPKFDAGRPSRRASPSISISCCSSARRSAPAAVEKPLREKFRPIGIGPGRKFARTRRSRPR